LRVVSTKQKEVQGLAGKQPIFRPVRLIYLEKKWILIALFSPLVPKSIRGLGLDSMSRFLI
jgi:hypothetical protein